MIEDMIDFFFLKILPVIFVMIVLGLLVIVPIAIKQNAEYQNCLKECFMQEHKTKECEYMLWKYENRTKNNTTVMPMPVVVR